MTWTALAWTWAIAAPVVGIVLGVMIAAVGGDDE
jgi:hypothetical protein